MESPLFLFGYDRSGTTLLSMVPLIAVSFSVLKGFGVHNQIEPMLLQLLAPLGDKGVEITNQVIGFVNNIKVGVLGSLGLAMLLYTVISLIKKIESAFNDVLAYYPICDLTVNAFGNSHRPGRPGHSRRTT